MRASYHGVHMAACHACHDWPRARAQSKQSVGEERGRQTDTPMRLPPLPSSYCFLLLLLLPCPIISISRGRPPRPTGFGKRGSSAVTAASWVPPPWNLAHLHTSMAQQCVEVSQLIYVNSNDEVEISPSLPKAPLL